jgi:hypothetical protein
MSMGDVPRVRRDVHHATPHAARTHVLGRLGKRRLGLLERVKKVALACIGTTADANVASRRRRGERTECCDADGVQRMLVRSR